MESRTDGRECPSKDPGAQTGPSPRRRILGPQEYGSRSDTPPPGLRSSRLPEGDGHETLGGDARVTVAVTVTVGDMLRVGTPCPFTTRV